MSHIKDLATAAVHAGKDIILTNSPGLGNITSILDKLETDGFKVESINLAHSDLSVYGIPFIEDGNVKFSFPNSMVEADVILLDQAEVASSDSMELVTALVNHRTIRASKFPNLKSVIVVFTEISKDKTESTLIQKFTNGITGGKLIGLAA